MSRHPPTRVQISRSRLQSLFQSMQDPLVGRALSIECIVVKPTCRVIHGCLHSRHLRPAILHQVSDEEIKLCIDTLLRPSNAQSWPIDEVLERENEVVREYQRDASSEEALIQMVCPRRCAFRNDAEVRAAHDLEVLLNEAANAHIGQDRQLRQGSSHCVVLIIPMISRKSSMEVEDDVALATWLVHLLHALHPLPICVAWHHHVLPRRETAGPASRSEGFSREEDGMRYEISPRWECVREVDDKALVREDEDVIHALLPREVLQAAHELLEEFFGLRGLPVLRMMIDYNLGVEVVTFYSGQTGLQSLRRQVQVTGTVIWHNEEVCLFRVQSPASRRLQISVDHHFNAPLSS
mmetsp:Transcript_22660/g.52894  ORF Transcript_22660/g.52894 Transcript_22660/m.52894 type:complete len:352 (+) Transcript_22660:68-1123(+)